MNEKMRLKLPAKASEVQKFLALASDFSSPAVLTVNVVHVESTRDYTGDSNDDAADWLVVGT